MSRLTLLTLALLTFGASEAHAQESFYKVKQPPPAGTGWTYTDIGFTFADSIVLDDGAQELDGAGAPGMVFGVGAYWRTSRIDLGVLFQGLSSFYFNGIDATQFASGAQFRAAANLRWRYIEDSWGALYMRLTPGLMVFDHGVKVREQAGIRKGGGPTNDPVGVDEHSVGFSLGFDFGLMFYLTDRIALSVDLDLVSGTSTIDTSGGEVNYGVIRTIIAAGIEWRM